MELKGQVEDIIYQNEVNAYTICTMSIGEEETITAVGYLPFIHGGDTLKIYGKYVTHQEYGEQFKIETFEKLMPETLEGLEKYLASGVIKGIGPSTAKKIIDTFGEETISIFKLEPKKLSQIKGISLDKAIEIGQEFNEKWELWQIVGFLERFGISNSNAKKVYDVLGISAISEIESNPYCLLDITYGVDFKQIDQMAMNLGLEYNHTKRIESAIRYALVTSSYNGHTCVIKENLIKYIIDLIDVGTEEIENSLISLYARKNIIIETRDQLEWIYLYPFYKAEKNIAERIYTLSKAQNTKKVKNIGTILRKQEEEFGIQLSDKQKEAIETVNENNVCIITGGPGTGKTTIIRNIIEIYKEKGMKVVLCAPTGRAAKRITEQTGEEAKTIHRLLEIGKIQEENILETIDCDVSPVDGDVVIIDEMSMVDVFLMNYILKGIFLGTKVIFVGDINQLASVGPGNILKDIIESYQVATVSLNEIFRQAAKSKIIVNAHNVNNGQTFTKKNISDIEETEQNEDFFYIKEQDSNKILEQVISLSTGRLKAYGDYEFLTSIQILTPTKKGNLGTKELNKALQKAINTKKENKREKTYGDQVFREGDRVMQIKNNYDIYWEREKEHGAGVFNGELGLIKEIDEDAKQIKVMFDDKKISWYAYTELEQLEHSYSITIHKSQGSEFDVVILPLSMSSPMLLTRNLLYTGLTRAKKLLIVIGPEKIIDFMVQNTDSKIRNTGLKYKLTEIFEAIQ